MFCYTVLVGDGIDPIAGAIDLINLMPPVRITYSFNRPFTIENSAHAARAQLSSSVFSMSADLNRREKN